MRKVQPKVTGSDKSVLSVPRSSTASRNEVFGLFGGSSRQVDGQTRQSVRSSSPEDFDGSIRNELLRLLKLPLSDLDIDPDPSSISVGQMFALILMRKATKDGMLNAITEVLDRIEGKATKAAQNKPTNTHISDQLDANLDSLDDLAGE